MQFPTFVVRLACFVPVALALGVHAIAQRPPAQLDSAAILHRMHELEVLGSVLYIAAHPDDENTRLISYLANGRQVRTAYLSLTRGDGGQNLIGPELGDALGLLRTQELLEARRIDGGEQYFTRAIDFGYSKSSEETFAKWGKAEVLGDVVRVIRHFRPDVIITRFDTDGTGGHGHHTASALLAHEAFDLAADPRAYPEQVAQGFEPWQTRRLYFNGSTWWRSDLATIAKADTEHWLTVDVGGFDPLLGQSYTELAGRSRSQHKSQGFGAAETRGETLEYLRLSKGAKLARPDLFDGIETTWKRVRGGDAILARIRAITLAYEPEAPERSLPALSELVRALDALASAEHPERALAATKAEAARRLILQVCGTVVEATADSPRAAAGDALKVSLSALARRPSSGLEVADFRAPGGAVIEARGALSSSRAFSVEFDHAIDGEHTIDEPYWLSAPHDGLFHPRAGEYFGFEPKSRASSVFSGTLKLADGLELRVERELMHKWVDRVAGERTRPVVVTPVASIEVGDPVAIVRSERASVSVVIEALRDTGNGELRATLPAGWSLETPIPPIEGLKRGERRSVRIDVRREHGAQAGQLRVAFVGPEGSADRTLHVIDYPHILPQTWYTPAEITLLPLDVKVDVHTVGYVDGAGDDVPSALRRLGVAVERIDPSSATDAELDACDAIVTGIRAYNTVPALAHFHARLLAYVERGGTLLVQYNTNGNDLVLKARDIGPRPFALTRERVTVEEAPPTFLAPEHPLMNVPNAITAEDFAGWVQERGLYFAGELDGAYTSLIAWSDPGEKLVSGAWIACDHGEGRFIYTGLSLFRQLPAGVPGAYRLLANLLQRRTRRA
ncbi:MAG: PIG-L family deacetylase [Planctomycetota bacterium]